MRARGGDRLGRGRAAPRRASAFRVSSSRTGTWTSLLQVQAANSRPMDGRRRLACRTSSSSTPRMASTTTVGAASSQIAGDIERPDDIGRQVLRRPLPAGERGDRRPALRERRQDQRRIGDRLGAVDDGGDQRRRHKPEAERPGDEAKHGTIGRMDRRQRQSPDGADRAADAADRVGPPLTADRLAIAAPGRYMRRLRRGGRVVEGARLERV